MARLNSYRRYGSIRILRDGRVRFSPWTFPVLSYLSFLLSDELITVEIQGRQVMDMDLSRGRMVLANFRYSLTPEELRKTVSTLRSAANGIERWIVPALEFTSLASTFREDNPKTYAIVPELLESCRDLPIADQWKRVRATVIAKAQKAGAEAERADVKEPAPGEIAEKGTPARKRRKATVSQSPEEARAARRRSKRSQ